MKNTILILCVVLAVFASADKTTLNKAELKELKEEGYVIKRDKKTKKGFISFDINRTIDDVFKDIKNLKSYPKKIEDVSRVEVYDERDNIVKARIFIDTFFVSFKNSVLHYIDDNKRHISWELDGDFNDTNYFAKMDGYWSLKKLDENNTRVFYANDLEFKGWVPSFLEGYLFDKGLKQSTFWLKPQD